MTESDEVTIMSRMSKARFARMNTASRRERLARAGALILGIGRVRGALQRSPKGRAVGRAVLRALLDERSESR